MATQSTGTELTAFRRGPNGNTISLTLAQLLEEGKGIAASSQTDWSLKNNYIQPSLLMALLGKLGDSLPPLDATMALDLRGYHLEPLSTEEFVKIFKAMQLSSLQGLIIQFGCEVFVPKLFAALYQVGCEAWLNTRVYLDLPFVSQTLEEMLAQIIQLNIKSQKRLDFLESKYDQPAQALKAVNEYIAADSLALEPIVTKAVYDFLEGKKEIMHMSHYQFAAKDKGDIDGVVVGELSGRKHVVLCEAKHNVTAQIKNAKRELLKAKYRWDELCDISMEYEELSSIDQEDIDALRIREFRSCSVIFAVGGTNFPENGIALKQPWIAVPLTDNRSGSAVFMKV